MEDFTQLIKMILEAVLDGQKYRYNDLIEQAEQQKKCITALEEIFKQTEIKALLNFNFVIENSERKYVGASSFESEHMEVFDSDGIKRFIKDALSDNLYNWLMKKAEERPHFKDYFINAKTRQGFN